MLANPEARPDPGPNRKPLLRALAMAMVLQPIAIVLLGPTSAQGQESSRFFPSRALLPQVLAGPREPVTSAALMGVFRNPNQHGNGVEAEVSLATAFPIYLLSGAPDRSPVVLGLEAAAYARFGLQVLERELVATDWIFAVPFVWHHENGWARFRYFHTSSHMGDEYARRFQDPGLNVSRDAVEVFFFRQLVPTGGAWAGARYGYNMHPEGDRQWVLRAGAQLESPHDSRSFSPFLATDVEWDQQAGMRPRVEARFGAWLPRMDGMRRIRASLVVLSGPSPLGQFRFRSTTQIGISLQGNL